MVAFNDSKPRTLLQAARHFTPDIADEYVASIKWPDGPCCPKCGSVNVGFIASRRRFQCREKQCRKQFSLITGTIMEATHLRLDQWCMAVWMIVSCRNGVSSCEIARAIGCKQQSAWHLLHRVRHILKIENTEPMRGAIEVDETFVGGLLKNMPEERRQRARARGNKGKAVVHAMRERKSGTIRAEVIPAATTENVRDIILNGVKRGSFLYSDSATIYDWAQSSWFRHKSVNHGVGEYVRGTCHVNGCENFFNCLRRGIKGTYICPSPEHLEAYVDEQVFRFNFRKDSEWERFDRAMHLILGKRLTYSQLTDGAVR